MIRARLQIARPGDAGRLQSPGPAWLAHARPGGRGPSRGEAPAAGREDAVRPVDLEGNWIVRGYPSGRPSA